jgi:hypothetical protein
MRGTTPIAAMLAALAVCACGSEPEATAPVGERPASVADWKEHRAELDRTVWADERLAGEHEGTFVALWDALLAAQGDDAAATIDALSSLRFDTLSIATPARGEELDLGIETWTIAEPPVTALTPAAWREWLEERSAAGLRLVQSEFHHARFTPPRGGAPGASRVSLVLHVEDAANGRRIAIDGELGVVWSGDRDAAGHPIPAAIDASGLRALVRAGPVPFERVLTHEWRDGAARARVHPVIVYDLDGDGLSEIVSIGAARVLWNDGGGSFHDAPLLEHPHPLVEAAAIGDLDGDALPDLISARPRGDVVVYRGGPDGRFPHEPRVTPRLDEPLRAPSAIALGDVDGDGDLDVWLAQYKPAYEGGQMPQPFYDANDGYPSHLFLNAGDGTLVPATAAAGLGERRHRRTYASTFVDLDGDADLDLVVVSDYAGVDLHRNDGTGRFTDANDMLKGDRHLFGMSASFADFDLDGRLDFFAAGMASTTARRLEALGLGRDDRADIQDMRMRMAWGNRMYLARDGGFEEPEWKAQVARTGWTWGTTAFDFDNDGDRDLFAANGHVSGDSTSDYCSNFWTHDIYDGASTPDPALADLFAEVGEGLRTGSMSWDGYQKKQLLMNRDGQGFTNVAFPMGVAESFDARSAVSEDLDADGRVDLVLVEDHGADGQRLHVYRNTLDTGGDWIGIRLREQGGGRSPVGAMVSVRTRTRTHVAPILTGETLMGQHSTTVHFGLGDGADVEAIEVGWVGGARVTIENPETRRYHIVSAP